MLRRNRNNMRSKSELDKVSLGLTMANDKKSILNIISPSEQVAIRPHAVAEMPKAMRTQKELMPLALRIMENSELMQQFRSVFGLEDGDRARDLISDITKHAQSLDPSTTIPEGTQIVFIMMKLVGHPGENK
jgi:hypothetical protein